jgi:hypothetical protein
MSDYRNVNPDYPNSDDPLRRDTRYDQDVSGGNTAWRWIAAVVFVIVVLAVAVGIGHAPTGPNRLANNMSPPASSTAPPLGQAPATNGPASPAFTPAPKNNSQP